MVTYTTDGGDVGGRVVAPARAHRVAHRAGLRLRSRRPAGAQGRHGRRRRRLIRSATGPAGSRRRVRPSRPRSRHPRGRRGPRPSGASSPVSMSCGVADEPSWVSMTRRLPVCVPGADASRGVAHEAGVDVDHGALGAHDHAERRAARERRGRAEGGAGGGLEQRPDRGAVDVVGEDRPVGRAGHDERLAGRHDRHRARRAEPVGAAGMNRLDTSGSAGAAGVVDVVGRVVVVVPPPRVRGGGRGRRERRAGRGRAARRWPGCRRWPRSGTSRCSATRRRSGPGTRRGRRTSSGPALRPERAGDGGGERARRRRCRRRTAGSTRPADRWRRRSGGCRRRW